MSYPSHDESLFFNFQNLSGKKTNSFNKIYVYIVVYRGEHFCLNRKIAYIKTVSYIHILHKTSLYVFVCVCVCVCVCAL